MTTPLDPNRLRPERLDIKPVGEDPLPDRPLSHEQAVEAFHWWMGRALTVASAPKEPDDHDLRMVAMATAIAQAWATYANIAFFSQPQVVHVSQLEQEHAGDTVVPNYVPGLIFDGREHTAVIRDGRAIALRFPTPRGEIELPTTLTNVEMTAILDHAEKVLPTP